MTARRTSLGAALVGLIAAGCASPDLLALAPRDRLPVELEAPTVTVVLAGLDDLRPRAEREGRRPRSEDRSVPFVGEVEVERGSQVSGDGDLGDAPLEGLEATLREYLRSIEHVSVLEADAEDPDRAAADYVLQVEVLHLVAASYRSRREVEVPVADWFLDTDLEQRFLPVASAVLRLRLRSADGRFRAARVVNASVLGSPDEADAPAALVAAATRAAAHEARQLTASWLVRAGAAPSAPPPPAPDSFLVHAVDVNRTAVLLARIDRRTGQPLWIERRAGLPLIGPPGVWHLAPFDEHGVLLAPAEYAALSEALSEDFALQRVEQLMVYRYLGPLAR